VGADAEGERLRASLAADAVDGARVLGVPGRPTLAKQRLLAGDQLLLRFDSGSTEPVDEGTEARLIDALRAAHAEAETVVVSDYRYGVITDSVRRALAELQAERALPLIIDARDLSAYAACHPTAVKPNYAEA